MVHGMGFRDRKHLCYWGRVPKRLESLGAEVFFGHQDSVGSVESNADIIAKSLDEILAKTGAEKVNILAVPPKALRFHHNDALLQKGETIHD